MSDVHDGIVVIGCNTRGELIAAAVLGGRPRPRASDRQPLNALRRT
jgi:hypothetical protein